MGAGLEDLLPSNRPTIIGWTRLGSLEDLRSSVGFVLGDRRIGAKAVKAGATLLVEGPEPLLVSSVVGRLPGVSWTAAGIRGRTPGEVSAGARVLSRAYLRRGDRFVVRAEGSTPMAASDLGGRVTSSILESAKGSRVSDESPKVVFRAAGDGESGAVGVQVSEGPGGIPTGEEEVACLVSGGIHSSVLAWFALLQGLRVRLVHAASGEDGLRAVAGLYSELSHRVAPRGLSLEVLGGDTLRGALSAYASKSKTDVIAGFSRPGKVHWIPKAKSPLYLLPQERFSAEFEGLHIKAPDTQTDWEGGESRVPTARFGGRRADISGVLDGLWPRSGTRS